MTASRKPRRRNGEGSIRHDKVRDRWEARVMVGGRRKSLYAKTEREAVELARRYDRTPLASAASFGDVLDRYAAKENGRAANAGLSPITVELRDGRLDRVTPTLRRRRVDSLVSEDFRGIYRTMQETGICRETIKKTRRQLSAVLDWARDEGIAVRGNPARAAELPEGITETRPRRSLTVDEVARLRDVASRARCGLPILDVAIGLCLRPGELLDLHWSDVDFDAGTVTISTALIDGKVSGGPVKTRYAAKTLQPPTPRVMAALREQQARIRRLRQHHLATGQRWTEQGLVFPNMYGDVTTEDNWNAQVERLCAKADVERITANELRHTGASLLLDAGVSRDAVARLLRHNGTRMLDEHYGHDIADVVRIEAPDVLAPVIPIRAAS